MCDTAQPPRRSTTPDSFSHRPQALESISPYLCRMMIYDDLLTRLKRLEALLSQPPDALQVAHTEALSIARQAPTPAIGELAAKVVAEINELKRKPNDVRTTDIPLQKALEQLRLALAHGKRDSERPA
jgi:hypothetical protein